MAQTFIRWAGSKRKSLPKLRHFWSADYKRYVEPFAGSACLFFDIEPQDALLGDLNLELVTTLRAIKHNVGVVLECLHRLPIGKDHYYSIRAKDPTDLPETDRAARFLYLNRFCFNGLYRTNRAGAFNVPYGPPKSLSLLSEESILRAASVLQRATVLHADFERTLDRTVPGDFVYLDPPYVIASRRMFSDYTPGTFSHADLERLRRSLLMLQQRKIPFVITYADSREARNLLQDFQPRRIRTHRHIAGFASYRRGSYELLATNIEL